MPEPNNKQVTPESPDHPKENPQKEWNPSFSDILAQGDGPDPDFVRALIERRKRQESKP